MPQKHPRVGSAVGRIGIGEVHAYIAQGCRAEQGVAQGVKSHVGIAVAEQPEGVGHMNATQYQVSPFDETVDIIARSYAEIIHNR